MLIFSQKDAAKEQLAEFVDVAQKKASAIETLINRLVETDGVNIRNKNAEK